MTFFALSLFNNSLITNIDGLLREDFTGTSLGVVLEMVTLEGKGLSKVLLLLCRLNQFIQEFLQFFWSLFYSA